MAENMSSSDELGPLCQLLDSVLARLAEVENQLGIDAAKPLAISSVEAKSGTDAITSPSLDAYDAHMKNAVVPLCESCDALPGLKEKCIGDSLRAAWDGIRVIVELAARCKKPTNDLSGALSPHLKTTQESIANIRQARLDRTYDWHQKALMEMLASLSWILITPPPKTPSLFVNDTLGAAEFWSNKIRKQYKAGNTADDEAHIQFCETLSSVIRDLSSYTKEHHLSGLCWNPNGVPFAEGEILLSKAEGTSLDRSPADGMGALMGELASRQTSDGSSAATGLRHVKKEEQTWRKEFKETEGVKDTPPPPSPSPSAKTISTEVKKKVHAVNPICEFESTAKKWKIEYQTKDSSSGGQMKIEIKDPKEQVYIYKCEDVTIQLDGKIKAITVDGCSKTNVVFDTAISSCEVVNCNRVQMQTLGVCPNFSIDKTDGCLIYLSEKTVSVTSIVASKSTEMNVSFPDEKGEMKELPVPEQFMHQIVDGVVKSEVSDLYH